MNELRPALRTAPGGRRFRDLSQQLDAIIWEADATTRQYTFRWGARQGRKAAGQGAGLGLALVRGLVELHGWRVWAESTGQGPRLARSRRPQAGRAEPPGCDRIHREV